MKMKGNRMYCCIMRSASRDLEVAAFHIDELINGCWNNDRLNLLVKQKGEKKKKTDAYSFIFPSIDKQRLHNIKEDNI